MSDDEQQPETHEEQKVEEFEQAGSGASTTYPMQCSAIKKNSHVVIKGRPCKVVETSTSKTGKHGHAKVHMVAIDIFTGRKMEEICPSTHNMDVPVVTRKDYPLTFISDDGFLGLMLDNGNLKEDLRLPEGELGDQVRAAYDAAQAANKDILVSVVAAMGEEHLVAFKEAATSNK